MTHNVKKVDVVRHNPRMTETVGDDGTIDPDFLSKARKAPTLIKPYHMAYTHIDDEVWSRIFNSNEDDASSSHSTVD